jgi:molybdopterin converting factor small subunit
MSDFEKWFRSLNANGKTVYFLGNEHKVSEMAWNHQQAIIDQLKAQLNNMKACYIEKKKQVDELQNRINEALEDLEYPVAPWDETIGSVVKVLRGDE